MSNEKFPEENNIFDLDEYRKKKVKDGGDEHLVAEGGKKGAVVSLGKYKESLLQKRLMQIVNMRFRDVAKKSAGDFEKAYPLIAKELKENLMLPPDATREEVFQMLWATWGRGDKKAGFQ